jgi:hypothetical protein
VARPGSSRDLAARAAREAKADEQLEELKKKMGKG